MTAGSLKTFFTASWRTAYLRPSLIGVGLEGAARSKLFRESCPLGHLHLADTDGVLIEVTE